MNAELDIDDLGPVQRSFAKEYARWMQKRE